MKMYKIYRKDCMVLLPELDTSSVDMIFCDLPYGVTKLEWDKIIPFKKMWKQINRVIKNKAAVVFTCTQPFTSRLICSNLEMFKYCWVWIKTKPTGYQICKVKPLSRHEDVAVFCKSSLNYYPIMSLRNKPRNGFVHRTNSQMKISQGGTHKEYKEYTHKYPTTVIEIPNGSQKGKLHPTQKPIDLVKYFIQTYTKENDTVLDFTMGAGTTGVACLQLKRKFIGCEIEKSYYEIAKNALRKEKKQWMDSFLR